jgi:hypothetical protein
MARKKRSLRCRLLEIQLLGVCSLWCLQHQAEGLHLQLVWKQFASWQKKRVLSRKVENYPGREPGRILRITWEGGLGGVEGGAAAGAAGGLLQQLVITFQRSHLCRGATQGAPQVGGTAGSRPRRPAEHAEAGQRRHLLAQTLHRQFKNASDYHFRQSLLPLGSLMSCQMQDASHRLLVGIFAVGEGTRACIQERTFICDERKHQLDKAKKFSESNIGSQMPRWIGSIVSQTE